MNRNLGALIFYYFAAGFAAGAAGFGAADVAGFGRVAEGAVGTGAATPEDAL
jgi:hypothetical protein